MSIISSQYHKPKTLRKASQARTSANLDSTKLGWSHISSIPQQIAWMFREPWLSFQHASVNGCVYNTWDALVTPDLSKSGKQTPSFTSRTAPRFRHCLISTFVCTSSPHLARDLSAFLLSHINFDYSAGVRWQYLDMQQLQKFQNPELPRMILAVASHHILMLQSLWPWTDVSQCQHSVAVSLLCWPFISVFGFSTSVMRVGPTAKAR